MESGAVRNKIRRRAPFQITGRPGRFHPNPERSAAERGTAVNASSLAPSVFSRF